MCITKITSLRNLGYLSRVFSSVSSLLSNSHVRLIKKDGDSLTDEKNEIKLSPLVFFYEEYVVLLCVRVHLW